MQKLSRLRLRLWQGQAFLSIFTVSVLFISTLSISEPAFSQEVQEQERGIHMGGSKSIAVFPYDRYGPITHRDTLWTIALTVRPDSRLTVHQVMQALYQASPNSFIDNNFNHLVEGQYLKIPSFDHMMSVNINVAKQKSNQDDEIWQKKQLKKITKKISVPQVLTVKKKEVDTVKVEINDQLKKIAHEQQKRLSSISNDVLGSIDGLQAVLKENEALRQRLTSLNNQLGTMQKEVAKGKEIKQEMDDTIKLQQALLEKQQVALEKDNIFSSLWFIVLMAILSAILILSVVALIFTRRKTETITSQSKLKKKPKINQENIAKEPKAPKESKALINEIDIDDPLMAADDFAEGAFDKETLTELLKDTTSEHAAELTSDFSDQNVLADIIKNENSDNSHVSKTTEINDIQALDSLNFDELLANIEEESSIANQSADFNKSQDVDDDISPTNVDHITLSTSANDNKQVTKNEQNFVSVDSLLSASQDEISHDEPYEKTNIDVGLNEFSEFTDDVNQIDVDIDDNCMAAKLDLAKVYIEIGDQDNAQVILQEVIKQGDTQQQIEAQELLDSSY